MKWIRRLIVLLSGLLLGSALLLTVAVLFLEEADYKRLLVWGAERFLDSQLVIDGPISVDISRDLSLASGDILLKANDDSYRLSVGKFNASFRLGSYLQTGTFWINNLELTDVNLEVTETSTETPGDDFILEDLYIPPVVIAQAHFNNLVLAYQELHPGTLHTFSLAELTIGELGEHQPVSLRATGLFKGQPFVLQGTADPLAQLVEGREPLALQLELSSAPINAQLQGTIADPVNGHGLDLRVQIDIPQVRDIIEILGDDIPQLGNLQASLTVRGDYTAPRLDAIDLHLQRDTEVDLIIRGSVDDALTGAGLDLQLDGQSSNPEVLSWLSFRKQDRMQRVEISGRLKKDATGFSLHDLDASVETADGLKLQLSGSAIVHPAGHRLTPADAGLVVRFSAPTLAAANLIGLADIPELGSLSGSLALALGMDAVGIYNADIDIGSPSNSRILLKGDAGYVQLSEKLELSGLKLQIDIQTAELARLGKQLGYALPALGPARLRGTLLSQGSELVLQDTRLDIGSTEQSLHATGMLATQLHDPARFRVAMDVNIQAAELARLGKQLGYTLPALGPARLRGTLLSQGSELVLQDTRLDIGSTEQSLHATGLLATQLHDPARFRVAMDVNIQATEFAQLAEPFGYTLPELGQTLITGRLETRKTELLVEDVRLTVGAAEQPSIRATGRLTTQLQKGSTVNVALDVAVADLVTAFSEKLPGYLGRLEGDVEISDLDGQWGIERFSLASTQTSLYQLKLSGRFDDLVNYDAASINLSLAIDSLEKLGETLDLNLTGVGSYRMQGQFTADKGRLRYQGGTTLGSTTSTTEISGHLQDGKLVLNGGTEIPVLHLADFGMGSSGRHIPAEPSEEEKEPARPHVFSREPLNLAFLNDFDLDLVLSIDEVENGRRVIDSVKSRLQLHNGHLSIAPLRFVFEGGNTDIKLDLWATAIPEYRLVIISDDVSLGPLMAQVQGEVRIQGYANMHLDLHTQGRSPHEMASGLSGKVSLGLENARIPQKYIDLLSVDVFGWVVSKTVAREPYSNLNCLVMDFAVNAGKVKSETLLVDGPRLNLGGKINMNLGEETLDIVLIPKQKKRVFSSVTPVKVTGPMLDPQIDAIPAKAAMKEVGSLLLLPGMFIPVRAFEKLWSLMDDGDKVSDGCANIDEQLEAEKNDAKENKEVKQAAPVRRK